MQIKQRLPLIFGIPDTRFFDGFKAEKAFVAELRPGLEGARSVSRQLLKHKIQPVIICDNMMAFCMSQGLVARVHIFYKSRSKEMLVCRTGSFIAGLCAKMHGVPIFIHRGPGGVSKAASLLKIGGKTVTSGRIKTYAPLWEEVPLKLLET